MEKKGTLDGFISIKRKKQSNDSDENNTNIDLHSKKNPQSKITNQENLISKPAEKKEYIIVIVLQEMKIKIKQEKKCLILKMWNQKKINGIIIINVKKEDLIIYVILQIIFVTKIKKCIYLMVQLLLLEI